MNPKYKEQWAFFETYRGPRTSPRHTARPDGSMSAHELRHFVDCVIAWHNQEAVSLGVDDATRIEALYEITFDVDALQKALKAK
jgi:hypothetical protein